MPGQHNANTRLLGFYGQRPFVRMIDDQRGEKSRSEILREAAVEYLERRGQIVPEEYKHGPDRAGKGGPTKGHLNSKTAAAAKVAAQRAAAEVRPARPSPKK